MWCHSPVRPSSIQRLVDPAGGFGQVAGQQPNGLPGLRRVVLVSLVGVAVAERQTEPVDVDEAAERLYALPPGDFIGARDALVREARESGDRGLAGEIAELRKPTAVAWLANRLARERPEQLSDFLALGGPLREASATLSGPALRDLSRQRQQLVHALVREARQVVADEPGPRVTEDVARGLETTLHAALADPAAGAAVAHGRLSGALSHTGFDVAPPGGPAPPTPQRAPGRTTGTTRKKGADAPTAADRRAAERAQIEAELARAWSDAREAAEERETAAVAATDAATAYSEARSRVTGLQAELQRLQEQLSEAERARDEARSGRERAKAVSERAERAAERARKAVTDLQGRLERHSR
jgi:hypothetical protein